MPDTEPKAAIYAIVVKLQQAKTLMELNGVSCEYPEISRSLFNIEQKYGVSAAKLRDEFQEYEQQFVQTRNELLGSLTDLLAIASIKWGNLDPNANAVMDRAHAAIAGATGQ